MVELKGGEEEEGWAYMRVTSPFYDHDILGLYVDIVPQTMSDHMAIQKFDGSTNWFLMNMCMFMILCKRLSEFIKPTKYDGIYGVYLFTYCEVYFSCMVHVWS